MESGFEIRVEFVGYTGCVNASTEDDGSYLDKLVEFESSGLLLSEGASPSARCECVTESGTRSSTLGRGEAGYASRGSLFCTWSVPHARVVSSPVVRVTARPACSACVASTDDVHVTCF